MMTAGFVWFASATRCGREAPAVGSSGLIDPRASREAPQISGSWTPLLGSTGKFDEPGEIHGEAVKDREPMHQFAFALRLLQEN